MLRPPDFREIQVKDMGKWPAYVQTLLEPLNRIIEYLKRAFNGNIGATNLNIQTINLTIEAPFQETRVAKDKPEDVYTVQIAQILDEEGGPPAGLTNVSWFEDGNSIVIKNIFGLGGGVVYNVKLMVLYQ